MRSYTLTHSEQSRPSHGSEHAPPADGVRGDSRSGDSRIPDARSSSLHAPTSPAKGVLTWGLLLLLVLLLPLAWYLLPLILVAGCLCVAARSWLEEPLPAVRLRVAVLLALPVGVSLWLMVTLACLAMVGGSVPQ